LLCVWVCLTQISVWSRLTSTEGFFVRRILSSVFASLFFVGTAHAQNATTAGLTSAPSPTINNVALEWAITGDADLDGAVSVRYRLQGQSTWRPAQTLRRVPAGSNLSFSWGNRHSGSVFNLAPASTYEFELALVDPDGGSETRIVSATTRRIPSIPTSGVVRATTPATLANVLGLAQAGDIVELGAGNYAGFTINTSGTDGLPIVLRGTPGAVINGELGIFNRSNIFLSALTINGRIRFNGTNNMSIVGCTVNAQSTVGGGDGIVTLLRAENSYIAENIVTGTTQWLESSLGVSGNNLGEGILVTGPGHVIARNTVRGFRDNISLLEDTPGSDQYSIDIIDNTISIAGDDGIEADFCAHNCRIMRNQLTNTFIAFSSQPSLGGPTYFIRNQAYNVIHIPFKLYRSSVGDVLWHNTIVKNGDGFNAYPGVSINNALVANNLFLGGAAATYSGFSSGSGRVVDLQSLNTANSSLNYNGYGSALGTFTGRIGSVSFNSLIEMRNLTSEANAQQVDYNIFNNTVPFPVPGNPFIVYAPVNLNIRVDSNAANTGVMLANINDGFTGSAPDLGALEAVSADGIFASGFE
jgi:hypothetical protein